MAYTKKTWKDYPDTSTPITADDLNNIEEGIENVDTRLSDEEYYVTATAGSNGDFHVTLSNTTLTTNRVVKIAFPTATNPASNARLSIDGGTTYYNLTNNNLNQLKGAGVENLKGVLVFDGSNWRIEKIGDINLTVNIAPNTQITLSSVIGKTEVWAFYTGGYNERCMMVYNANLSNNSVWFMTSRANGTDFKNFGLLVDFTTGVVRNDNLSAVNIVKLIVRQ